MLRVFSSLLLAMSMFFVGCSSTAPLATEQTGIQDKFDAIPPSESVIVGSFLVNTLPLQPTDKEPSMWSGGRWADKSAYSLWFNNTSFLATKHNLYANANKEVYFVKRVPAGFYVFQNLGMGAFEGPFRDSFYAEAGQVTYIGKITATVPAVLRPGIGFSRARVNDIEAARAEIKKSLPEVALKMTISPRDSDRLK
jgi:hypothetical protein